MIYSTKCYILSVGPEFPAADVRMLAAAHSSKYESLLRLLNIYSINVTVVGSHKSIWFHLHSLVYKSLLYISFSTIVHRWLNSYFFSFKCCIVFATQKPSPNIYPFKLICFSSEQLTRASSVKWQTWIWSGKLPVTLLLLGPSFD